MKNILALLLTLTIASCALGQGNGYYGHFSGNGGLSSTDASSTGLSNLIAANIVGTMSNNTTGNAATASALAPNATASGLTLTGSSTNSSLMSPATNGFITVTANGTTLWTNPVARQAYATLVFQITPGPSTANVTLITSNSPTDVTTNELQAAASASEVIWTLYAFCQSNTVLALTTSENTAGDIQLKASSLQYH